MRCAERSGALSGCRRRRRRRSSFSASSSRTAAQTAKTTKSSSSLDGDEDDDEEDDDQERCDRENDIDRRKEDLVSSLAGKKRGEGKGEHENNPTNKDRNKKGHAVNVVTNLAGDGTRRCRNACARNAPSKFAFVLAPKRARSDPGRPAFMIGDSQQIAGKLAENSRVQKYCPAKNAISIFCW